MHMNRNVAPAGKGGYGAAVPGPAGLSEEDRSKDWYCPSCQNRNFVKRIGCVLCGTPRPAESKTAGKSKGPELGKDLNGFVKSYNRKGFGFIMCPGNNQCQDIYYSRENLHQMLQNRDISGEHITFELARGPDGKLTAIKVRPIGQTMACFTQGDNNSGKGTGKDSKLFGPNNEDRSRDWECHACGERNFMKRNECYKCKTTRQGTEASPPRRTFSPHAGSRAVREAISKGKGGDGGPKRTFSPRDGSRAVREAIMASRNSSSRSRSALKKRKKKKKKSSSSSSDDSSDDRSRRKKKDKKRSRSSSSSAAELLSSDDEAPAQESVQAEMDKLLAIDGAKTEVEQAKFEALEKLKTLRTVEPKELRMTEWRSLLRRWHPDKNPENTEVATAVFQFLQKAKPALDAMA